MRDDETEPNSNKSSQDIPRNHRSSRKNYEEEDHSYRSSRTKQRTTAIALSVVTCLFMCVIAYEIIRENAPRKDDLQVQAEPARPSLLLSKMSLRDHKSNDFSAEGDEDSEYYENHQIRALQDQNRKQAGKIKALRQELADKMHAVHEIKTSLFKQEGDPRDRAKIVDLTRKLEEKEKTANQLAASMKTMEIELANLHRKIEHSEVTRDALASMIETHRIAKEQERIIAQKQLEELRDSSSSQILTLEKNALELEKTLAQIEREHKEKLDDLEQMDKELTQQYQLLDAKTSDHESLASLYHQTREAMSKEILDLVASWEWEATSKSHLTKNFEAIIHLLEAELRNRNEVIALKEQDESQNRFTMGFSANRAQQQIISLITILELEMTRASFLQQELDKALYITKEKIGHKTSTIAQLEQQIKEQHLVLEKTSSELENLMNTLAHNSQDHQNKIQALFLSHQIESLTAQHLHETLAQHAQQELEIASQIQSAMQPNTQEYQAWDWNPQDAHDSQIAKLKEALESEIRKKNLIQSDLEKMFSAYTHEKEKYKQTTEDLKKLILAYNGETQRHRTTEAELKNIITAYNEQIKKNKATEEELKKALLAYQAEKERIQGLREKLQEPVADHHSY